MFTRTYIKPKPEQGTVLSQSLRNHGNLETSRVIQAHTYENRTRNIPQQFRSQCVLRELLNQTIRGACFECPESLIDEPANRSWLAGVCGDSENGFIERRGILGIVLLYSTIK